MSVLNSQEIADQPDSDARFSKADPARRSLVSRFGPPLLLWLVFFLACFGFGYPTLTRYDIRETNSDTIQYYQLVISGPQAAAGRWRYRLLVPLVARPFYLFAQGRVGAWEPVFFGLLVANSLFCAATACFLVATGFRLTGNAAVALLAATLYLMNFAIPNFQLAGMVDSAEACLIMALTWALFAGRWLLLPLIGLAGGMAKETFVPLASVYALTWCSIGRLKRRRSSFIWIVVMAATSLATVVVIQSAISGNVVWPWEIAAAENIRIDYLQSFVLSISDQRFWYVFIWLLPLGVWRLSLLPSAWVMASITAAITAWGLGIFVNARGHAARPMFDVAGPVLSLSAAILLAEMTTYRSARRQSAAQWIHHDELQSHCSRSADGLDKD